jgi:pyruvate dehydrogenase E2 component (dihydrolipoamide acetyltransferase)
MATEVKLPRLGQGMESGTIVRWLKSEGDKVEKGEPLYELDTEKVTQEVEAEASGVLLKIAVQEGEVEVGRTIAVLGEEGEEVSVDGGGNGSQPAAAEEPQAREAKEAEETEEAEEAEVDEEPAEEGSRAPARDAERERGRAASVETAREAPSGPTRVDGRVKASPLARRIARERGVDLAAISGTGPEGRIVAEDVERAAAQPAPAIAAPEAVPAGEVEEVELTSIRKTIARRLTEAWQAPAFQISMSADMTRTLALREKLVESKPEDGAKPTVSDVLTKVCAAALMRHREINAHFAGDRVLRFPTANVGIAVAAPQGLLVPVIKGADRLTIQEIANVRADLVARTRDAKLKQEDLADGTFTISNLGMYGVDQFIAVLNPPQAAILAVGAAEPRAVVEGGDVVVRPTMTMTLTCDHRAVDGAVASDFLRTVKAFLEEPGLAL